MAGWLRQHIGDAIVRGPEASRLWMCGSELLWAGVRLRPGTWASLPLGVRRESGVEARP